MSGRRFLLATRSEGKLRELREIFAEFGLEVKDLATLGIPESARENDLEEFETFEENALAKVRHFFELSGGIPTFGDDSGMCVDALGGEPGVYSKRWSGREDLEREALDAATNAVAARVPHEMLLLDLYGALRPLDEITGATTTDDILNLIFGTFCIGK